MFDRFSSVPDVFIRLCLGVFVFATSACVAPPPAGASPGIVATCPSPTTNPYRQYQPPNQVTNIFSSYKSDPSIYENIKQDAFTQLGKYTQQWSDYEDVYINERLVRITVTYLDPMLVQFIVLNDALVPPNNSLSQGWFEDQIRTTMVSLEKRNEIIFIVTITSQLNESALSVEFPLANLELVSLSGRRVRPTHHDPILDERNDVSHRPVFGYIGYPISLALSGGCMDVVDQWTTSLKLDLKSSLPQDHPFYPLFWNIPYPALVVLQGNDRPIPTMNPFGVYEFSKSETPPPPYQVMNDASAIKYWEEMGRYIWSKVILINDK